MENNSDIWIVNPDEYEDSCIVIRSKTAYVYCYPINKEVLASGAKVVTRDGKTVKRVQLDSTGYTGILDGEEVMWDSAGRYIGPYKDSPNDLYICERYFRKDWQEHIQMGNAEWAFRYGRLHPGVKMPKRSN